MNTWHRTFFDALEDRNWAGLTAAMWMLPLLILWLHIRNDRAGALPHDAAIALGEWVTDFLLARWIDGNAITGCNSRL